MMHLRTDGRHADRYIPRTYWSVNKNPLVMRISGQKRYLLNLKEDDLEIKHIPIDPDTGDFKAAEELKAQLSHQQFQTHCVGTTEKYYEQIRSFQENNPIHKSISRNHAKRFSSELSMCCQAEFENTARM